MNLHDHILAIDPVNVSPSTPAWVINVYGTDNTTSCVASLNRMDGIWQFIDPKKGYVFSDRKDALGRAKLAIERLGYVLTPGPNADIYYIESPPMTRKDMVAAVQEVRDGA